MTNLLIFATNVPIHVPKWWVKDDVGKTYSLAPSDVWTTPTCRKDNQHLDYMTEVHTYSYWTAPVHTIYKCICKYTVLYSKNTYSDHTSKIRQCVHMCAYM